MIHMTAIYAQELHKELDEHELMTMVMSYFEYLQGKNKPDHEGFIPAIFIVA